MEEEEGTQENGIPKIERNMFHGGSAQRYDLCQMVLRD
jgi:hypothetical protein